MHSTVIVVGSSNTDMIVQLDRLPRPGETVVGGRFATAAGGKGANQAVAAARAGGKVAFIARVGGDTLGAQAIAGYRRDGIRVDHVSRDRAARSGVALIVVDRHGENSIAVAGGANARLSPRDVRNARRLFDGARAVLMQLEIPLATVRAASDLAAEACVPVILNPAPARRLPRSLLRRVAILTPNEIEAEVLTGVPVRNTRGASVAADRLLDQGVGTVIITLGARGAFVATQDMKQHIQGFKVKTLDTTAAGDVFNGALAVALGEGRSLLDAVRFAQAAAAISVTRLGAQPSAPYRREIERLLRK